MALQAQCPNPSCGRIHEVSATELGRRGRCRHCGWRFIVSADSAASVVPPPVPLAPPPIVNLAAETNQAPIGAQPTLGPPRAYGAPPGVPARVGRFEVRGMLGAGAMGAVYRAWDPLLGREVAVKVPQPALWDGPASASRFLREAQAAAQLRHPHIVPVYDAGSDGDRYYLAAAYIEGQTLEAASRGAPLEFSSAAQIVRDLAEALDYAHGLGIVHRDVKPANIMLDGRGEALLMDFGLARLETTAEKLTHDEAILGTPAYMAPEQASRDLGPVGPASDQYSLGVVLYELLCGQRPFSGPPAILIFNAINQPPPSPRGLRPDIPRDLETICLKAMSKQMAGRYARCQELADDLRRWQDDQPIHARRMGAVERTLRWARRQPVLAALGAAVMMLAVAASIASLALQRSRGQLTSALGEAQRQARRAEKALVDAQKENVARRKAEASLEEREREVLAKQQELEAKQQALEKQGKQLARRDADLEERARAIERLQADLAESEQLAMRRQQDAAEATQARDKVLSTSSWLSYLEHLEDARQALADDKFDAARASLNACPAEHRAWEWNVLSALAAGKDAFEQWAMPAVSGSAVKALDLSPDGSLLAIVAQGFRGSKAYSSLIVLDTTNGKPVADLGEVFRNAARGSERPVQLVWNLHRRMLAAVEQSEVSVWDLTSSNVEPIRVRCRTGGKQLSCAAFSGDGSTLLALAGNTLLTFDPETGETEGSKVILAGLGRFDPHRDGGMRVTDDGAWLFRFPPVGNAMVVSLSQRRLLPVESGEQVIDAVPTELPISAYRAQAGDNRPTVGDRSPAIAFSPDGTVVVGAGGAIASAMNGTLLGRLGTPVDPIAFHSDGRRLACLDQQTKALVLFDTDELAAGVGRQVLNWRQSFPTGSPFDLSSDWRAAAALGADGQVRGWAWKPASDQSE